MRSIWASRWLSCALVLAAQGAAADPSSGGSLSEEGGVPSESESQGAALGGGPPSVALAASSVSLSLEEVRSSVKAHHPLVTQSLERQRRAEAAELAASGYFDPLLRGQAKTTTGAYYELRSLDVELRQQTGVWGVEVFGGYRNAQRVNGGSYPTYYSDETLPGGELRLGAELPFFRGGPIDAGRARLWSARASTTAAQLGFERQRLDLELAAARAYFRWVAAGQKLEISEDILAFAEERGRQLAERAALGASSEFDRLDNERIVFERRERIATARREFEQASLELGLFYRDASGERSVPRRQLVPMTWIPLERAPSTRESLERKILSCHPQVQQLRAELEALEVELRLAENQVAPDLRAAGQVSRDLGDENVNPALAGTVFEAQLKLTLPLLLRADRGMRDARKASVREKLAEIRFVVDRLATLVEDLESRERAARERREQTDAQSEVARQLADGERERFGGGTSNLLFVNVRELAAADAEARHIDAEAQLHDVAFEIRLLGELPCNSGER